jgi:DNA invertase Pin-like site-specific DNA recombinase
MTQVRDQGPEMVQADPMAESAGVLLRVSSGGQDEENQQPELDGYTHDRGYRVNKTYRLHDKSAFHGEHESVLAQILEDIRAGVISVVVIVHSSRIDRRDPKVAEHYELSIRMAGGRIESVREPLFGKADIAGRITTILAQYQNHDYSRVLSGHVRAGHNRVRANRQALGKGLLGRAPWGYEIQGARYFKVLVPSPLGLKYIPEIFDRIVAGESLATVAAWLNAEGAPTGTRRGRDRGHHAVDKPPSWSAPTVQKIVRNPVYKGQMRTKAGDYFGSCEALVSSAVWNAAGKRLDSFPKRGPLNTGKRAMLAGVAWCGYCGSAVYRSTSETRVYYRCAGKVTGKSCFMVSLAAADRTVDAIMAANPLPVMKLTLAPGKNYEDELDAIEAQVRALKLGTPGYAEQHAALTAEWGRLRDLDCTPDEWKELPTGQTWGQLWSALEPCQRGPWLQREGFAVTVSRERVSVAQGTLRRSAALLAPAPAQAAA